MNYEVFFVANKLYQLLQSLQLVGWSFYSTAVTVVPNSIHPLSVTTSSLFFTGSWGLLLDPVPAVSGQVASSSPGPSLMAEAATMQGANRTSGAIWGSVSCSRTLRHAAQISPRELGFVPATQATAAPGTKLFCTIMCACNARLIAKKKANLDSGFRTG